HDFFEFGSNELARFIFLPPSIGLLLSLFSTPCHVFSPATSSPSGPLGDFPSRLRGIRRCYAGNFGTSFDGCSCSYCAAAISEASGEYQLSSSSGRLETANISRINHYLSLSQLKHLHVDFPSLHRDFVPSSLILSSSRIVGSDLIPLETVKFSCKVDPKTILTLLHSALLPRLNPARLSYEDVTSSSPFYVLNGPPLLSQWTGIETIDRCHISFTALTSIVQGGPDWNAALSLFAISRCELLDDDASALPFALNGHQDQSSIYSDKLRTFTVFDFDASETLED
ncbi:hypothetical protein BDY24DRAFT_437601, partial [Mrakia frigida]|uniref:uncharacterized protein n=1 Tax=Mrakia frigida TaxID=29902 RepID=UPI003FCC13B9